jgi:hypothetical protein
MTLSRVRMAGIAALVWACTLTTAFAFDLITADEARRPNPPAADNGGRAGPTLGPVITFRLSARGATTTSSPFNLTIDFTSRGGAKLKRESIHVSYLKRPPVDLLPRIQGFIDRAFTSPSTRTAHVEIQDARAPVGKHQILVEVEDSLGQSAEQRLDFEVLNPE